METAGLPLRRLSESMLAAPSSTRATSWMRSTEPSGLARSTMSPNCSGVTSRPWVWTLSWNCWSSSVGRAPMRPTGAWMFCCWMAVMMSEGASLRLISRLVSNQTRIE